MFDNVVYILTNNNIILCDEYGNILEEKKIPEKFSSIYIDGTAIFLFSKSKKYFYKLNSHWEKIEFPHGVSDICGNDRLILILDGSGSNLYIHNYLLNLLSFIDVTLGLKDRNKFPERNGKLLVK